MVSQPHFRAALLDPGAERPTGLSDGTGAPAGRRFDVYRNNVAVSLTEALETAFPVVAKLVGATNFKVVAGAFLRAHPPSSPLLMHYGAEMPDFLATFPPTAVTRYLPDIARIELALRQSYHAADAPPFDPAGLATLDPAALDALVLRIAPSVRLVRSDWPIHAIWRFNTVSGAPKPVMAAEDILIARPEFDPVVLLLWPGGATFVDALQRGTPLGDATTEATEADPAFDLARMLNLLMTNGALAGETP